MLIICGYVKGGLQPETEAALRRYAPAAQLLDFTGNEYAYWEAISVRWGKGDDLVIIEQDIEITSDVLPSFEGCNKPWCTFGYESRVGSNEYWSNSLGCVRFKAELQANIPLGHPQSWFGIDTYIQTEIWASGYSMMEHPHIHGRVNHHHHSHPGDYLLSRNDKSLNRPPPLSQGTCHCGKEFRSYLKGVTMCPRHQAESKR